VETAAEAIRRIDVLCPWLVGWRIVTAERMSALSAGAWSCGV